MKLARLIFDKELSTLTFNLDRIKISLSLPTTVKTLEIEGTAEPDIIHINTNLGKTSITLLDGVDTILTDSDIATIKDYFSSYRPVELVVRGLLKIPNNLKNTALFRYANILFCYDSIRQEQGKNVEIINAYNMYNYKEVSKFCRDGKVSLHLEVSNMCEEELYLVMETKERFAKEILMALDNK